MESGNHMDSGEDVRQDEFADFTIRLKDGREIKCHKIILARVSPVFLRILRHDNVETRTNTMTLDAFECGICAGPSNGRDTRQGASGPKFEPEHSAALVGVVVDDYTRPRPLVGPLQAKLGTFVRNLLD